MPTRPPFRLLLWLILSGTAAAAPIRALIVDGQNNHDWQASTPHLQRVLENTGIFTVDVATAPPKGGDLSGFQPRFADYAVVVSNYHGQAWPAEAQRAFVAYVRDGGGFVVVHSASNAFPEWADYNEITGLGGWEGRDERSGPWVFWDGSGVIRDSSPGKGGDHGDIHRFVVVTRAPGHAIMRGLPTEWLHADDELYNRLRGPARNLTVLATAFDDPKIRGSGRHEPILFTVDYGRGRVFHTTLGHVRKGDLTAMRCVGFIVTLQRGAEWAATGKVTQPVPVDFPKSGAESLRTSATSASP